MGINKVNKEELVTTTSEENIYRLNGRVPIAKAIPFGLQHVLAMFVSNLAPVLIVCGAAVIRGSGDSLTGPKSHACSNARCLSLASALACSCIRYGRSVQSCRS